MMERDAIGFGRLGATRAAAAIGFCAIFGIVFLANIAASLRSGRLAAPPGYDDVVYLSDALDRISFAPGTGLASLLASFWQLPPHAPVSTLTAMAGFWLLGPADLSAYLANGWVLALYIALMAHLSRPLENVWLRLMLVALLAYVPVAAALVTEFRPDFAGGLVFAIAIATVCRTDFRTAPLGRLALAMALGVAATVIKPTACIVSIPGFGVACMATLLYQGLSRRDGRRRLVGRAILALGLYVLLMAPFAIVFARSTYYYVSSVLFTNSDVWRTAGDRWFHLTYHFAGTGPVRALGPFRLVAFGLVAVDLVLSVVRPSRRRPETVPFAATLVVVYAAMSLSNEKTAYQGCFFYLPLLVAAVLAFVHIAAAAASTNAIGRRAVGVVLAAALLLAIPALPISSVPYSSLPDREQANRLRPLVAAAIVRIYTEEWAGSEDCKAHRPALIVTNPFPLTADSILMEVTRHGVQARNASNNMLRTMDEAIPALDAIDFVVTADPSVRPVDYHLPISKLIPDIYRYLDGRTDTRKIGIGNYFGQPYWLFARPLCKAEPAESKTVPF